MDTVYVSIAIFIFTTLTGFFITIQSARHSNISKNIAEFDGEISFFYRSIIIFGEDSQKKMKDIILDHYEKIYEYKN
jgi:hypothetical protein